MRSTRKITAAMKMVAAAKLHRAQRAIGSMVPYADSLQRIVAHLVADGDKVQTPYAAEREPLTVKIISFASNGTLCGVYNQSVVRHTQERLQHYSSLPRAQRLVVAVGKQAEVGLAKEDVHLTGGYDNFADKPSYATAAAMAAELMEDFVLERVDRVELVYYKFHSAGRQELVHEVLLPVTIEVDKEGEEIEPTEYILEPSKQELLDEIIPRTVALNLYTAALSASASEHAARMVAMQAATDNADDLVAELAVEYNKQRQQAITAELLDIMGGQTGR